jgi:hypothetical protein
MYDQAALSFDFPYALNPININIFVSATKAKIVFIALFGIFMLISFTY